MCGQPAQIGDLRTGRRHQDLPEIGVTGWTSVTCLNGRFGINVRLIGPEVPTLSDLRPPGPVFDTACKATGHVLHHESLARLLFEPGARGRAMMPDTLPGPKASAISAGLDA